MALTVSDIAERCDVSPQTVRTWCNTFNEWLSPSATPPAGEVRTFTSDDLNVLDLVADMRVKRIGYEDIKTALASGERATAADSVLTEGGATGEVEGEQGRALALAMRYEAQIAFRDGQISQLQQSEEQLREALTEAQRRATRAETLLEQYQQGKAPRTVGEDPFPDQRSEVIEGATIEEREPLSTPEGHKWWQVWKRLRVFD